MMMSKIDKVCAAARMLDLGVDPDNRDRIRRETGCTKRQSEEIADSMRDQIAFMEYLDRLDRDLRA